MVSGAIIRTETSCYGGVRLCLLSTPVRMCMCVAFAGPKCGRLLFLVERVYVL